MHTLNRILLLVSLLALPTALIAEGITPRFFSPKRTGDSYWFLDTRTSNNTTIVTQNGEVIDSQKGGFTSLLEANATVITNNATGKAIEERFSVIQFIVSDAAGEDRELLAPGTIFFGRLNLGEKVFTYADGTPVPTDAATYLKQVIALRDNSITDQDIFGTKTPINIGDTWPVNTSLAAEDFNFDMSMIVDSDNLTGATTLIDVPVIDGIPYVHVISQMNIEQAKLPAQQNINTIKGDLNFTSETWLPQEGPVYPYEQRMDMTIDFIAEPLTQSEFTKRRIRINSTINAVVKSKPLPRDESVTTLDRTRGIRR